jgi:iron(III) transport system permease protein
MAQPAAAVAPRPVSATLVGTAAGVLVLVVLVALVMWPLADVFVVGLLVVPPPLRVVANTLAVACAATLGAVGMAAVLAVAVRVGVPGRRGLIAICRVGVLVPVFVVPLGVLALAGRDRAGLPALVIAQAFAFLPHAFALVMRALARVSTEAEQAAELLGASRWTVLRRVTLGLAAPGLAAAALVVLGLCLADVASPLLVGGREPMTVETTVLANFIVAAGAHGVASTMAGAVALSVLAIAVALAGRTWRYVTAPLAVPTVPLAAQRPAATMRAALAVLAWLATAALVALWAVVPLASLEHWNGLAGAFPALVGSVALGFGAALAATILALSVAWLAERRRGAAAGAMTVLARVPVVVPGLVGGVGYLVAFGALEGGFGVAALLVAAWELPLMLRVAGNVLARSDRSAEQAALTLGASPVTTLRRVVLPALRTAVVWLVCHGFAAGITALGTVVIFAPQIGLDLGTLHMLAAASTGSVGAACAVATVLLALAGGATLLGRAAAGRETIPTLLA